MTLLPKFPLKFEHYFSIKMQFFNPAEYNIRERLESIDILSNVAEDKDGAKKKKESLEGEIVNLKSEIIE